MIKRIICTLFAMILSFSICGCGFSQNESIQAETNIESEVKDGYYIITTDYMTFYFSTKDFGGNEILEINDEAVMIMNEIHDYLNAGHSGKGSVCYFDSSYVDENGLSRSYCYPEDKVIYCLSLYDFVHEYVHIVMENNTELVYVPADIFRKGFAQYVSLNFFDNISESSYSFFKEPPISKNSNEAEHNQISKLLTDNDLEYNAKNYTKAFVYLCSRNYDLSELDTSSDFYNYYVGYLLTEYCVNELGGLNRFISVYYDSITIEETYGKTLYEIINKACDNNEKLFK